MDFSDFLNSLRVQGTSGQRARQIALAREAGQDAREKRQADAEAARAAERRERLMMTAAQLGIDAGSVTRASLMVGEEKARNDDLRARLAKSDKVLAAAQKNMLEVTRMMDAAMGAAGEPAVRSLGGGGIGDLAQDSAGNLVHVPGGWLGG